MPIRAKITKKGQVTIPQKIQQELNSEVVEFDILETGVRLIGDSLEVLRKIGEERVEVREKRKTNEVAKD